MRAQAIAEYHELLAADTTLTADFLANLKERMRARRLVYGGREIGVALRPHFLDGAQYDALVYAAEVLAGAFDRLAELVVAAPALLAELGLTEREHELALVEPGYKTPAVNTRLDAFVHESEIKFVEYNAENPSSLTDQAGLNEVLFELSAMQTLAARYRLRQLAPAQSLLQALLTTYREWGGQAAPNVAIVDWGDLPTADEFTLLRNYFTGRGVPTLICTPDELEYTQGRLRCGDFTIDLVYKRVIIHELLAQAADTHPLLRAYRAHAVCLVNSFRCKLLHKKAAFELLTDEARAGWQTPAQREVVRRCVPWTRRVRPRRTQLHGQTIDLLEHVRRQRADFVLKPNDDYGGHGLLLGSHATASQWDDMLTTALAGDYVVQELIELHTEEFPIFDAQGWALQPMYVDTNPFLFHGRVDGALVRLSDSPVVNVTSGGGETGFFILIGRSAD